MIDIDYLFEDDAVRRVCQSGQVLTDEALAEWEMLMRFRINTVEVLGQSQEQYQRWLDQLKRDHLALHVPSAAWCLVPVLSIALSIEDAFSRLHENDHAELATVDEPTIRLAQHDDLVTVRVACARVAQAPRVELHAALASFANRVRADFLAVCPQLRNHVRLGWWFRDDAPPPAVEPHVIHLPAAKRHGSHSEDWETLQHLQERIYDPQTPSGELLTYLSHDGALIRTNVLLALGTRPATEMVVTALMNAATNQKNSVRLMGTVSVGHVAVAALLRLGTETARAAAQHLLDQWPEPDREDLLWYLRTEKLW